VLHFRRSERQPHYNRRQQLGNGVPDTTLHRFMAGKRVVSMVPRTQIAINHRLEWCLIHGLFVKGENMAGHVFITRGDVTRLACDAWLMPCGRVPKRPQFLPPHLSDFTDWPTSPAFFAPPPPLGPPDAGSRFAEVTGWPADEPRPWLVNTGGTPQTPPEWYAQGLRQVLEALVPILRHQEPRFHRSRPLVATPVVGIGGGRLEDIGRAVHDILNNLYQVASKDDIDFVLVTLGEKQHAAAMFQRDQFANVWPSLTAEQRQHADRLAQLAVEGRLALFLGAGVSQNAGLPGWGEMLHRIAASNGVATDGLQDLGILDQASYLAWRLSSWDSDASVHGLVDGESRLRREVCGLVGSDRHHYSLMHSLLAALPVTQAITTNYDQLFELAWDQAAAKNAAQLRNGGRVGACSNSAQ
jgi:hypothetical protein